MRYRTTFRLDEELSAQFEACQDKGKIIADALRLYFTFGNNLAQLDGRIVQIEKKVQQILDLLSQVSEMRVCNPAFGQKPEVFDEDNEKLDILLDRLSMD